MATRQTAPTARFPEFCNPASLFAVFFVAELVVLVLMLSPAQIDRLNWSRLGLNSLFAQWVALCAAASWCGLRELLQRAPAWLGYGLAWLLLLLLAAACTVLAYWTDGWLQLEATASPVASLVLGNVAVSALVGAAALRYFYVQTRWRHDVESRAEAQVEALQARIRPHFLFNSLNAIASLTRRQPERAEAAIEDLADLFRATLSATDGRSSIADELALCRQYLALEQLRLGDRLEVSWDVDALPQDLQLPPLLLQPLIENAINHGIARLSVGGIVAIRGGRDADQWWLQVENPLPARAASSSAGAGIALQNIEARLKHAFGPRGKLVTRRGDGRFVARLSAPITGVREPRGQWGSWDR